jgi:hypothetical protein
LAAAILLVVICAASYDGFYQKWRLRDDEPRFSTSAMLDGAANRPFVYRRLLPEAANLAARVAPGWTQDLVDQVFAKSTSLHASRDSTDPRYAFRYRALYVLGYLCLLAAAGLLTVASASAASAAAGLMATGAFVLFLPLLQSKGGYVYDFSELLFLTAALLAARSGPSWLLIPLAAVGAYNKESFVFFIPALLPYLLARHRPAVALGLAAAAGAAALGVYAAVRERFAANPGAAAEFHLLANLRWYINPINLARPEITYGVVLFAGYSIVTIGLAAFVVAAGWRRLPRTDRLHLLAAAALNAPLMLLFAWPGETRNLSLTFPGFVLLTASAFQTLLLSPEPGRREPTSAG